MLENAGILPIAIGFSIATWIYISKRNYFNPITLISVVAGLFTATTFSQYTGIGYFVIYLSIGIFAAHTLISAYDLILLPITNKVSDFGKCDFKYGIIVKTLDTQTHCSTTTVREGVFGDIIADTNHYTNHHSSKAIKTPSGQIHIISETNDVTNASEGDYVLYAGGSGDQQFAFYNITKKKTQKAVKPTVTAVIGSSVIYSIPYIGTIIAFAGLILGSGLFKLKANPMLKSGVTPRDKGHLIFAFSAHVLTILAVVLTKNNTNLNALLSDIILALGTVNLIHFSAWMIDTNNFSKYIDNEAKRIIEEQHLPSLELNSFEEKHKDIATA